MVEGFFRQDILVHGFFRQDILWSKEFIDRTSYGSEI
jgi:hypothetical protein